jgi:hypothetical protein
MRFEPKAARRCVSLEPSSADDVDGEGANEDVDVGTSEMLRHGAGEPVALEERPRRHRRDDVAPGIEVPRRQRLELAHLVVLLRAELEHEVAHGAQPGRRA